MSETSAEPRADGRPAGAPVPLWRRFLSLPTLFSFAIAGAFLFFLFTRFNVEVGEVWRSLRRADPLLYLLALLANYTTFLFRGWRWRILLANSAEPGARPPGILHSALLILLGWFANSVTWFRLGDVYRAYAYSEDTGASFTRTVGTVVAERVIDLALVFGLVSISVVWLVLGGNGTSWTFVLLALLLLVVGVAVLLVMRFLRPWLVRVLPPRVARLYDNFYTGTVGSFGQMPAVVALGALGWLAEVARLYLVSRALGIDLAVPIVVFVTLANAMLTLVPITPGGLGVVEPGVIGLLGIWLVRTGAVSLALLDRSISYLSIVVVGALIFGAREVLKRRRIRRAGP